MNRTIKEIQKAAPFIENSSFIFLLGKLIIDVLILDGAGVRSLPSPGRCHPQTSAAWGWTAGQSGEQQALRSACASAQTAACCAYRSFSKTESSVMPPFIKIA